MITTRHKNHEADLVLTRESILFYPWSQWSLLMGQRSVSIPVLYPYSHSHREGKAQTQSLHMIYLLTSHSFLLGNLAKESNGLIVSVLCRANINTWIFNTYHYLSVIGLYLKVFYTVIMHIYKLRFNLKFSPYHVINFSLLLILHEQS